MDIILLQNMLNLGDKHDVVSVKPGYGRNYLIPQGYGVIANATNRKKLEKIIEEDQTVINNWLNTPVKTIKNESIKKGLSHSVFKPGKNRQERKNMIFKTLDPNSVCD